ncbi:MAG: hypothetical protein FWE80_04225 [Oscillospiraceae bacterium]|nr:hypothetical protein [Oscillospiraceae bacterium]
MAGETVEALIGCCTRDITALEQLYIRMKKPVMALAVGILQDFHLA